MTRYETYLWEMNNNLIPDVTTGDAAQRGKRICQPGSSAIDRRVLTVAIVRNCETPIGDVGAITGGSTEAVIDEWADVFLVEPVVDDNVERNRGRVQDSIYVEIIGEATLGGGGANTGGAQTIRRDTPYLVK